MRFAEVFQRFFRDLSEVSRDFSEVVRGPLRDPLRGRFASERLSVLLPPILLALELSPSTVHWLVRNCLKHVQSNSVPSRLLPNNCLL